MEGMRLHYQQPVSVKRVGSQRQRGPEKELVMCVSLYLTCAKTSSQSSVPKEMQMAIETYGISAPLLDLYIPLGQHDGMFCAMEYSIYIPLKSKAKLPVTEWIRLTSKAFYHRCVKELEKEFI